MSGRPTASPASLRVDVLKELQALIDNRETRDRLDKSPLAETKGREHWVLHLLLRAQEWEQAHSDALIGTAYSNLLSRLQAMDDRVARVEETQTAATTDLRERVDALSTSFGERVERGMDQATERLGRELNLQLGQNLDQKWKPVGESIESFAVGSRQVLKDVADTYRAATQSRLLLNENARRITDLGRDLLALEESLKLVVAKAIEDGLGAIEARLAALETHNGLAVAPRESAEKTESPADGT
jgi:hypothetical protein